LSVDYSFHFSKSNSNHLESSDFHPRYIGLKRGFSLGRGVDYWRDPHLLPEQTQSFLFSTLQNFIFL